MRTMFWRKKKFTSQQRHSEGFGVVYFYVLELSKVKYFVTVCGCHS